MSDRHAGLGQRSLSRFGIEFLVIVASILAAFALDAWWNGRVEQNDVRAQLRTVGTEFATIQAELESQGEGLDQVRAAVANLLPHISPTAPVLSLDSITALMDLSFRHGTIELQSGSLQALLASGQLAAIDHPGLAALLATWPAAAARLRTSSQMLEGNRELIIDYLHDRIPTLQIAEKTGQMGAYPPSSFTASGAVVQRDMKVEGMFGNRGILIEDTDLVIRELYEIATRITDLIDSTLTR